MPLLPTIRGRGRYADEDETTRLLLHPRSPKQHGPSTTRHGPLSPTPELQPLESPTAIRGAESEPHHSPAGYRTPPEEKQQREQARAAMRQLSLAPKYEGASTNSYEPIRGIDDATHTAQLKRRLQHHQPQQQIGLPTPTATDGGSKQQQQPQASLATQSQMMSQARGQRVSPALPNVMAVPGDKELSKQPEAAATQRKTSGQNAATTTTTATDSARAEAEAPTAAPKEGDHARSWFNLWGAVEGAAAALARLRFGAPHAPIVVTPMTAPLGFTFEAVDGHHKDDQTFHNPPDAAALAESEAARDADASEAGGSEAKDAAPRSRILDALVAGISRFGVLGIHHPIGLW